LNSPVGTDYFMRANGAREARVIQLALKVVF